MSVVKQSVGFDVSKETLEVKFLEQDDTRRVRIKGSRKFDNTFKGHQQIIDWCDKRQKNKNIVFIMEATGVYHEELLYFLHKKDKSVILELPQRIKYFAKSKGVKTKNDKIDSGVIAEYGLERELKVWQPPSESFKSLRDLSREHGALKHSRSIVLNRIHAANTAYKKDLKVLERLKEQIEFYDKQLEEVEKDMKEIVKADKEFSQKIKNIKTIKGIGFITIITVLAETGGFYLFKSISQLVSYAGLDVIENQSGKHNGKTRISKKGNSRLRTVMYMPSLSAIRFNKKMAALNDRVMKTHKYKKQGMIAVMRKLLILIYTLWKKNETYNNKYQSTNKKLSFG